MGGSPADYVRWASSIPRGRPDLVITESTYGNRLHEKLNERDHQLKDIVTRTIKKGGVLIIPAFAIERTQFLLFELNHLVENRLNGL